MDELWCPIRENPQYLISNFGRVQNSKTGRMLKQPLSHGYPRVNIKQNGFLTSFKVHRLVASAFVSGQLPGLEVNHIDGDKTNNFYKNLEWVTNLENIQHAVQTGLLRPSRTWVIEKDGSLTRIYRDNE